MTAEGNETRTLSCITTTGNSAIVCQVHGNCSTLHINVPFHTVRITKNMAPIHMLVPTRYKVGPLTYPAHYWMYGWADNTP